MLSTHEHGMKMVSHVPDTRPTMSSVGTDKALDFRDVGVMITLYISDIRHLDSLFGIIAFRPVQHHNAVRKYGSSRPTVWHQHLATARRTFYR
jgi:hypothetical protein